MDVIFLLELDVNRFIRYALTQVLKVSDLDSIGMPQRPDFMMNPHKYFSDGFSDIQSKGTKLPPLSSADVKTCEFLKLFYSWGFLLIHSLLVTTSQYTGRLGNEKLYVRMILKYVYILSLPIMQLFAF